MNKGLGLVAALVVLTFAPGLAHAQGYGGRGMVNTPFGMMGMGELQANGGDLFAAQEMRQQQQMMMQYQQQMQMQQQYMQQMAKNGQPNTMTGRDSPAPRLKATAKATKKKKTAKTKGALASKTAPAEKTNGDKMPADDDKMAEPKATAKK